MNRGEDELYGYYQRELDYLRNAGREFARQHPETARRLELGELESADPHVERLIESFAFLTGRVRRDLDNESSDMAAALLETMLPNSMAPLPPVTIVQLAIDTAKGKDSAGRHVPVHTPLTAFARPVQRGPDADDISCQFRTCYPLTLWPLSVAAVSYEDAGAHPGLERETDVAGVLRISLTCSAGMVFGAGEDGIAPQLLRFHLHDSWHNAGALYDWLLCHVKRVLVAPAGRRVADRVGDAGTWSEAGFGASDAVLPETGRAHPAYRQLQEYFAYPRKYLFFDAGNLAQALCGVGPRQQQADLLLLMTHRPPAGLRLHAGHQPVPAHHGNAAAGPASAGIPAGAGRAARSHHRDSYFAEGGSQLCRWPGRHPHVAVLRFWPGAARPVRRPVGGAPCAGRRTASRRNRCAAVVHGGGQRRRLYPYAAGLGQHAVHQPRAGRGTASRSARPGQFPRARFGRRAAGALPGTTDAADHAAAGRPPAVARAVAAEPEPADARPVERSARRQRAGHGAAIAGTGAWRQQSRWCAPGTGIDPL